MFSVRIPQDRVGPGLVFPDGSKLISAQSASLVGETPTAFKTCGWTVGREMLSKFPEYGDYVFLKSEKQDADTITLFFGKRKVGNAKNTPFNTFPDTRQYTWPAVLEDLWIVKTPNFPQAVNNGTTTDLADRLLPRYRFRPGVAYNSIVKVEQFLADSAWKEGDLTHEQPVPTDIDGSYIGLNIGYQRCLHPTVVLPRIGNETVIYGAGVIPPPRSRNVNRQVFPATNMLDWAPFVIEDRQQNVNGLWLRERVTIFPPPPPDETIQ